MDRLIKCLACGSYGIKTACSCGGQRVSPLPARYSPEDRYGVYRRRAKEERSQSDSSPRNEAL